MAAIEYVHQEQNNLMQNNRIKFWLGVACSGVFLFLAFRNVQWSELGAALQEVNWWYLVLATGLYILNLVMRGLRWQGLLAQLVSVTASEAFAYVNIGYMANNLLPLRAGEILRTVLLGQKKGISKSAVLATVALERLLDILALLILTGILIAVTPVPQWVRQGALAAGVVASVGAVGIWYVAGRQGHRWETFPRWIPHYLGQRAVDVLRSFIGGLAAVRSSRQTVVAMLYSVLAWGVVCGSTYLVLRACHLDLPWYAALLVIVAVNFGAAIPSSPGFIGVFHFLAMVALSAWVVDQNIALSFALVLHAMPFLLTLFLGFACMWREGLAFQRMAQMGTEASG